MPVVGSGTAGAKAKLRTARKPKGPELTEIRKIGFGDESNWQRKIRFPFFCGDISGEEYLKRAEPSRFERAWGNFVVGMEKLASGDRELAKRHFETSLSYQLTFSFFDAMGRALLTQLDRDPAWPPWIPLN